MPQKPYQIQAAAQLLGITVDSVRRTLEASGIEVQRRESGGPAVRLFSIENLFQLAHWRHHERDKSKPRIKRKVRATVYVPKGGVGKTTLAANMGCIFQLLGARTLIVDLDFQSNLTMSFGYDAEITREEAEREGRSPDKIIEYHFGHLFKDWPGDGNRSLSDVIKKPFGEYGPHLIPSDLTLDRLDTLLTYKALQGGSSDLVIPRLIAEGISGSNPNLDLSSYDVILFDAAPAKNRMTRGALLSSDYVITPVSMEKFSTKALSYLSLVLTEMQEEYGRHPELTVVGNFFDLNRPRVRHSLTEITRTYDKAWLDQTIRRSESIARMSETDDQIPVVLANPNDVAIKDIQAVGEALLERMGVI